MTRYRTVLAIAILSSFPMAAALAGPQPVTPGVSAPSTSVVSAGNVTTTQSSGRILFLLNTPR